MPHLRILQPAQAAEWQNVLDRSTQADFYHTADYHRLSQENGEGDPVMLVAQQDDRFLALPLLLRRLETVPGLESAKDWRDATSVYGYAGPIASHNDLSPELIDVLQGEIATALRELRVVAVFSRLHPLIQQTGWLRGLGECKPCGQTVSIDLTLSHEEQRAQYRKSHAEAFTRLAKLGFVAIRDAAKNYVEDFVRIYQETMERVGAESYYHFTNEYFEQLLCITGADVQLFVGLINGEVACGGVFTACRGIVQHHLGGTYTRFLKHSPIKAIHDAVRQWATDAGFHSFHLGGGVGGREDSLFQFKAGFSRRRHSFLVWRWILQPEVYDNLCNETLRWHNSHGVSVHSPDYFPQYRASAQTGSLR